MLKLVQPYLLEPSDTVNPTDRECYRLTVEDKRQIEAAIKKHGAHALENVTKGGAMLYLRFPLRFAGEDEEYLRSIFAPETLKPEPWDGPEKIVVTTFDSGEVGAGGRARLVVESYSPFEDRFARLPYKSMLPPGDTVVGYQFVATMQCRNSLSVLEQHGRIESFPPAILPKIIKEPWQGIWTPRTKSWRDLGINIDEIPKGDMASEIGYIPSDGGDYLRFLLVVKTIGAMDIDFREKLKLLEDVPYMYGQNGTSFGELEGRVPRSLVAIMETEFEYDEEEGGDEEE
ncbi:hypothetical protein [Pseudomonas chlororaphis]|nr:hypothetical protein [Pseudomonas chlororaphis]